MIRIEGLHCGPIGEPDSSVGRLGGAGLAIELHARICPIESVKNFRGDFGRGIVTPLRQLRFVDPEKTALCAKPERAVGVLYYRNELRAGQAVTGIESAPAVAIPAEQSTQCCDQERIISICNHGLNEISGRNILQFRRLEPPVQVTKQMVGAIRNPDAAALKIGSQKAKRDKVPGKRNAFPHLLMIDTK